MVLRSLPLDNEHQLNGLLQIYDIKIIISSLAYFESFFQPYLDLIFNYVIDQGFIEKVVFLERSKLNLSNKQLKHLFNSLHEYFISNNIKKKRVLKAFIVYYYNNREFITISKYFEDLFNKYEHLIKKFIDSKYSEYIYDNCYIVKLQDGGNAQKYDFYNIFEYYQTPSKKLLHACHNLLLATAPCLDDTNKIYEFISYDHLSIWKEKCLDMYNNELSYYNFELDKLLNIEILDGYKLVSYTNNFDSTEHINTIIVKLKDSNDKIHNLNIYNHSFNSNPNSSIKNIIANEFKVYLELPK